MVIGDIQLSSMDHNMHVKFMRKNVSFEDTLDGIVFVNLLIFITNVSAI